jgi:hypothetical protein
MHKSHFPDYLEESAKRMKIRIGGGSFARTVPGFRFICNFSSPDYYSSSFFIPFFCPLVKQKNAPKLK